MGEWKDEAFQPLTPKPTMPPPPEPSTDLPNPLDVVTPDFPDVVRNVLAEFGATLTFSDVTSCYSGPVANQTTTEFLNAMNDAKNDMMKKELDAMRSGLGRLGKAFSLLAV